MRRPSSWNKPPVVPGVAGQRQRLAAHLHLPVGVGHSAVFLRPRRGGQHNVGIDRGFREKEVLHHEMFEVRERLAGVIEIGIGHRWVSPMMYMPLITSAWTASMISTTVRPFLGGAGPPGVLVAGADLRILDRFVVGKEHRDQSGVGSALHIVLAAQRMQPSAGPADLAGDQ